MLTPDFATVFYRYKAALAEVGDGDTLSDDLALKLLRSRDALQIFITDNHPDALGVSLEIAECDLHLKALRARLVKGERLESWRSSFEPSAQAWWWDVPVVEATGKWQRFEWVFDGLTLIFFSGSLALFLDVASRFFGHGPHAASAFAVIFPAQLTLLSGGALTDIGKKALSHILTDWNVSSSYTKRASSFFAASVFVLFLCCYRLLPMIAHAYNSNGYREYRASHLSSALTNYKIAIALNPDYLEARYNLGIILEDLDQRKEAISEYEYVVKSRVDRSNIYVYLSGHNNLGRLYLLSENYPAAALQLLQGNTQINDYQDWLQSVEEGKRSDLHYAFLKNLGWLRLKQERYRGAQGFLEEAIALDDKRAPAHCLLAQVLTGVNADSSAIEQAWESCLTWANGGNPDEDAWIGLAEQFFEEMDGE